MKSYLFSRGSVKMLSSGNGYPMQCVANLIRITRGECVYDRIKGIDSTLIDKPGTVAKPLMQEDIRWLIKTYEPRANLKDIDISALAAEAGEHKLSIKAVAEE